MKLKVTSIAGLMFVGYFFVSHANADSTIVMTQPGALLSGATDGCTATLQKSLQGGFLQLLIGRNRSHLAGVADDVTAIAWVNPNLLVYSVSPVYGKPGIFLLSCNAVSRPSMLVSPMHFDKGYPDGADYFEIHAINGNQVSYYYGPDVDKVDFAKLRSNENLRKAELPVTQ